MIASARRLVPGGGENGRAKRQFQDFGRDEGQEAQRHRLLCADQQCQPAEAQCIDRHQPHQQHADRRDSSAAITLVRQITDRDGRQQEARQIATRRARHVGKPRTGGEDGGAHRAKAQPGKLTFASAGTGSPTHLSGELFRDMAGIDLLHVPYKGGGPAMNDVMSGEVDIYFAGLSTALPLVNAGRLHAHAITTSKRSDTVPTLPAISEFGFPNYSAIIWYGVLSPAGLPQPIVTMLHEHILVIMNMPEFRKQLSDSGAEIFDQGPAEFKAFMKEDLDKWAKVIAATKVTK